MLPMLTIVGLVSQNNIFYNCTKLHNHISKKNYLLHRVYHIFGRSGGGGEAHNPITFFLYLWVHLHNLK